MADDEATSAKRLRQALGALQSRPAAQEKVWLRSQELRGARRSRSDEHPRRRWASALVGGLAIAALGVLAIPLLTTHTQQNSPVAKNVVPVPRLFERHVGGGGGCSVPLPYYGPTRLSWAGSPLAAPTTGAVLSVPRLEDSAARAAAEHLSGSRVRSEYTNPASPDGKWFTYLLQDGRRANILDTDRFPHFYITAESVGSEQPGATIDMQAAEEIAIGYVDGHPLNGYSLGSPSVQTCADGSFLVEFAASVSVPKSPSSTLLDPFGYVVAMSVTLSAQGAVEEISGPLPLESTRANYSLRSFDQALHKALSDPSPFSASLLVVPSVILDRAEYAYIFANDGVRTYLEPVFLFRGGFSSDGNAYEKWVIVPALEAKWLTR